MIVFPWILMYVPCPGYFSLSEMLTWYIHSVASAKQSFLLVLSPVSLKLFCPSVHNWLYVQYMHSWSMWAPAVPSCQCFFTVIEVTHSITHAHTCQHLSTMAGVLCCCQMDLPHKTRTEAKLLQSITVMYNIVHVYRYSVWFNSSFSKVALFCTALWHCYI